ncbi:MAG: aminotransferase [Verrucomicrobia bacterium]|nr:MAG: aminotransferase [Verrucomicrobiota bacterium]
MQPPLASKWIILKIADSREREEIYRLRHDVYARELGQHAPNDGGALRDPLDEFNVYIVALLNGAIAGFISITPPERRVYSVDKYLRRADFPALLNDRLYEVRLLSVVNRYRGRELAFLLMYAALRWVESRGGDSLVAIGRREVLDLYLHVGLRRLGHTVQSGAVTYELLTATAAQLNARLNQFTPLLNRLEHSVDWRLDLPFRKPAACFHGGAFFDAIAKLQKDLPWLLRTSPPTGCEGLIQTIARVRGVPVECVLPAGGSSDAIFLALRQWLKPTSRMLILDPTYREYAHVLEHVVRCRVDRLALSRTDGYQLDLKEFERFTSRGYDLIVLVNPNSPTGRHVPQLELEKVLHRVPSDTRVWVDETYVEYAGPNESLEQFAATSGNVVVCKSMSKVYALSGVRVAYLCGPPDVIEKLRAITPPWAVGLPGQVAAVAALQDPDYYSARWAQTHRLREQLTEQLAAFEGWEIIPSVASFLLCHLPANGPDAAMLVKRCHAHGLFLRDAGAMGRNIGAHAIRIAVKDAATNRRMVEILFQANNRLAPMEKSLPSLQPV